jgi:hypothetical protein
MNEYITPVVTPGTDEPPEQVPVPAERLEAELCLMAGHIAAATCRFLDLVGEYDASGGWAAWDMRSCAEWLSWRCQIGPGTAREHVRVARALRALPVVHGEFAAGRMGYSKVREITRIATPATEAGLVEMMSPMTAGQAERFARAHRSCTQDQPGGAPEPRSSLRFRSDPDTGELTVSLHLPPADGAMVLQALRAATGDLDRQDRDPATAGAGQPEPVPDLSGDGWPVPFLVAATDLAAALVAICGGYLGGKIAAADNADIYQVHIHTTAQALTPAVPAVPAGTPQPPDVPAGTPDAIAQNVPAGTRQHRVPAGTAGLPAGHPAHPDRCHLEDGPAISPLTAQQIACSATLSVMVHGIDGSIAGTGRRSRKIPAALRRAVRERDRYRCTFPGCSTRRTEAHHIIYWSNGGPTELGNLLLLCSTHHHLVHARGYLITRAGTSWTFTDPGTGRTLAPAGPLPGSTGPVSDLHDADITGGTIQQALGERMDLHFAIWVALHNGKIAQDRYDQDRYDRDRQAA